MLYRERTSCMCHLQVCWNGWGGHLLEGTARHWLPSQASGDRRLPLGLWRYAASVVSPRQLLVEAKNPGGMTVGDPAAPTTAASDCIFDFRASYFLCSLEYMMCIFNSSPSCLSCGIEATHFAAQTFSASASSVAASSLFMLRRVRASASSTATLRRASSNLISAERLRSEKGQGRMTCTSRPSSIPPSCGGPAARIPEALSAEHQTRTLHRAIPAIRSGYSSRTQRYSLLVQREPLPSSDIARPSTSPQSAVDECICSLSCLRNASTACLCNDHALQSSYRLDAAGIRTPDCRLNHLRNNLFVDPAPSTLPLATSPPSWNSFLPLCYGPASV